MNYVIKIVLFLLTAFLAYKVYDSVASEIRYQQEVERIEQDVITRLEKIREIQMIYRDEKGEFASSWDSLIYFAKNGSMQIIREYGDKDDSTTVYRREVDRISVRDSIFRDFPIDSLPYVPHNTNKDKFTISANIIEQNKVKVPVFEVKDPAPFSRDRNKPDNPNPLKVGSLVEAKYSGNWK